MEKNVNCVSTTPEQMYAELISERKARLDSPEIMQIPTFQPKNSIRISEEIILAKDKKGRFTKEAQLKAFALPNKHKLMSIFAEARQGRLCDEAQIRAFELPNAAEIILIQAKKGASAMKLNSKALSYRMQQRLSVF